MRPLAGGCIAIALGLAAGQALAQDSCSNRGDLDLLYCDENRDLVADAPKDPKKFKNPSTLVFNLHPGGGSAVYENVFKPFTDYLSKCTGKRVVFYQVQSNAAEIEAMRSGRLHVGGFSTGPTNFAVNLAGAVPFRREGKCEGLAGVSVDLRGEARQPLPEARRPEGQEGAHVQPSSNPEISRRACCFRKRAWSPTRTTRCSIRQARPDRDGRSFGDFDGGPVASDVFKRMIDRGQIKPRTSASSIAARRFRPRRLRNAHDLEPKLRDTC